MATVGETKDRDLVKVGRQPDHDDIEGIVECEVVKDDGPHSSVAHHFNPRGGRRSPLPGSTFAFPGSQRHHCDPAI